MERGAGPQASRLCQLRRLRRPRRQHLDAPRARSPRLIWVNFAHLFMVSLVPFSTAWVADTRLAAIPVSVYGAVFVLVNLAYCVFVWETLAQAEVKEVSASPIAEMCALLRGSTKETYEERRIIHMRAIVIDHFGPGLDSLVIKEVPEPEPKLGHVVIEVKAFGVNHAEMHMRKGEWAEAAEISGIECVGIVNLNPTIILPIQAASFSFCSIL